MKIEKCTKQKCTKSTNFHRISIKANESRNNNERRSVKSHKTGRDESKVLKIFQKIKRTGNKEVNIKKQ